MTAGRPTIRDVAKTAGVSATTVSHALNEKGRVDAATRERVVAAAASLGYRASRTARSLRAGRAGAIALVLPTAPDADLIDLDYYMRVAAAAAHAAFAREHPLLLMPALREPGDVADLGMDGAILCDPVRDDPQLARLEAAGVAVVTIEHVPGRPDFPWVVRADNAGSTRAVLDHLAERGAERVAVLLPDADWAWPAEVEAAYRDWSATRGTAPVVARAGLSPGPSGGGAGLETSAHAAALRLLDAPQRPDAVLALAERTAGGVLRAARDAGLRVPADLLVASGNDSTAAATADPPVTAVDLRPAEQGATAAELLIDRLTGSTSAAPRITSWRLVERASTRR